MFNNILVPTDGSKLSEKAVQEAMLLAEMTCAKLVALHVYPEFAGSPYGTFGPSEDILAEAHVKQHKAEAGKLFDKITNLALAAGVKLDTALVQSNDVYAQIIATANPGCLLQLRAGVEIHKTGQEVVHVIELLDRACSKLL